MKKEMLLCCAAGSLSLSSCIYETPGTYEVPSFPVSAGVSEIEESATRANRRTETRRPSVEFPARLAVAYVKKGHNNKKLIFEENRSFERPEMMGSLATLPHLNGVVSLNGTIMKPETSLEQLSEGARALGANMMVVIQFETNSRRGNFLPILDVASLGLLPTKQIKTHVVGTLSLVDTKTLYVYGVQEERFEGTKHYSDAWNSQSVEKVTTEAKSEVLAQLIDKFPQLWNLARRKAR